jgi:CBS domain-containing protein
MRVWKKFFSSWITEPTPDAILKSLMFFDFRALHGNFGLAEDLRDSLATMVEGQTLFFACMANTIVKNTPPLGFLKSFVVEKSGVHKDTFDLKRKGSGPLVDAIRLFALEEDVRETSTPERIHALKQKHTAVQKHAEELEHAFEALMLLRIHHQFEQVASGRRPDNFINPKKLSTPDKKTIKEAFTLISRMQGFIIEKYKSVRW